MEGDCCEESGPTEVNTSTISHLVKVNKDKLTVMYNGKANHRMDVGSVQANRPFSRSSLVGYFEMTVLNAGTRGCMSIGLASSDFKNTGHPGWEPGSYGYHGDDGKKYCHSSRGEPYASKFGSEDVVGCGFNFASREIFFTKNGKSLGVAFINPDDSYFPTVGLHSEGEQIRLNFGEDPQLPFMYPLHLLLREEREKIAATVSNIPMSVMDINQLVANFLRHEGYLESLASFEQCAMLPQGEKKWSSSENEMKRSAIRQLIIQGNMEEAEGTIRERFPSVLEKNLRAKAFINSQKFIEMLLAEQQDDAIMFARENLSKILHESSTDSQMSESGAEEKEGPLRDPEIVSYLQEVIGLLAYEDPASSPLAHLLSSEHRKKVADVVNTAILEQDNVGSRSDLETLLKQLVACQDTLRRMKGGRGPKFVLEEAIRK
uniref:B30.2/SPRY domain-containing protein n=1 Tax=Hanusia phi TaxID=3032 RepID=A0A7S0HIE7_9CRYP